MHFMVVVVKNGIRNRKQFSGLTTQGQDELRTIKRRPNRFFATYKNFIPTPTGPFKRNALVSALSFARSGSQNVVIKDY